MTNEALFKIVCPSCEAVFAVTDPELVGQIIACPKCGGMILVEPQREAEQDVATVDASNESAESDVSNEQASVASDVAFERNEPTIADENKFDKRGEDEPDSAAATNRNDESALKENDSNAINGKKRRWLAACCGIGAALLVVGAAAIFFPRKNDEIVPTSEPNVASNGDELNENNENGENKRGDKKNDDSQLAPNEDENDDFSDVSTPETKTIFDGEETTIGEVGEVVTNAETSTEPFEVESEAEEETTEVESEAEEETTEVDAETVETVDSEDETNDEPPLDSSEVVADEQEIGVDFAIPDSASGEFNENEFNKANKTSENDAETVGEKTEDDLGAVASTTNLTLPTDLPTMSRETKAVDVDARLALRIRSIEFPSSSVAAVRLASEFSGVPIAFDWDAFDLLRPSTSAALDLSAQDVSVGEALEKIAALANWTVVKEKGRVELKPKDFDPTVLVEERFDVADLTRPSNPASNETDESGDLDRFLIPADLTAAAIERLVESFVSPNSWTRNGGQGTLKWEGATLIVFQTAQNRKKTAIFLELLRALRRLESKSDLTTDELIPETLAWDELSKTASFNLLAPTPLQNVLEILENSSKFPFQIFFDDAALNEAGVGRDASASVRVDAGTYDAILSEILDPLNLTYFPATKNLLIITSKERAERYKTVEAHFFDDSNAPRRTPEELENLAAELKLAVDPNGWTKQENNGNDEESIENNGLDVDSNVVWIDGESGALVVRQSAPNQRSIRRWLAARTATQAVEKTQTSKRKDGADGDVLKKENDNADSNDGAR